MKWFVYLFSCYVLVLSAIPCSIDDRCCMDEDTATTEPYTHANNNTKIPPSPCSPFFACGACHGVIIPTISIELLKISPAIAKLNNFYRAQAFPDFPAVIWQPPKYC